MSGQLRYDLARLSKICTGLLGLTIVAELAYAWDAYNLRGFLDAVDAGTLTGAELDAEADRVDNQSTVIGLAYLAIFLLTVIFSSVWIYRASWNAREIQPTEKRITPGWAVGWFFVPIMSLWKPYQAMRQCWNSSTNGMGALDAPAPGFVAWWWGLWIVTNIAGNASFRLSQNAVTTDDFRLISTLDLISAPVGILSSLLFIRLIKSITAAQREKSPGLASVFA